MKWNSLRGWDGLGDFFRRTGRSQRESDKRMWGGSCQRGTTWTCFRVSWMKKDLQLILKAYLTLALHESVVWNPTWIALEKCWKESMSWDSEFFVRHSRGFSPHPSHDGAHKLRCCYRWRTGKYCWSSVRRMGPGDGRDISIFLVGWMLHWISEQQHARNPSSKWIQSGKLHSHEFSS